MVMLFHDEYHVICCIQHGNLKFNLIVGKVGKVR